MRYGLGAARLLLHYGYPLLVLVPIASAIPAHAQSDDRDNYNIMAPERPAPREGETPVQTQKRRIGSSSPVYPTPLPPPLRYDPPPVATITPPALAVPPSMYVPQTGMLVPNLPSTTGSGSGIGETSQDRAIRCANQAGVYGPAQTGDRNAYIGSCINQ